MPGLFVLSRFALVAAVPLAAPAIAQPAISQMQLSKPITLQLDGVPTSALVTMLLRDVMRVPYVISPEVLADRRPTSVKLVIPRDQVPERVVAYLRKAGFAVQLQGGTVYVSKGGRFAAADPAPSAPVGASVPFGSPLEAASPVADPPNVGQGSAPLVAERYTPPPPPPPPGVVLAYLPAHRDPSYFSSVIAPLLPGLTFGARGDVSANTDRMAIDSNNAPDLLVLSGTADEIFRARQLIQLLDRPRPMVAVKAVVMQVSDVQARGSALSILAKIGGGKLEAGSFGSAAPAAQFVRIAAGGLSAMLSAVNEDSRFKVIATPNLAALSGNVSTMNSGSQVPTVGSTTVTEAGPVQSVVYRDSGITLTVRPVVRGELVELDVRQERSTFTRTTTGVEDSPTLQKASADASVILKSGESVVLAGLTEDRAGNSREGLLGGLLGVRSREKAASELLVVITAELVPTPPAPPGQFFDIQQEEVSEDDAA